MRHPTKKQMQKVIDYFTKVLPFAKEEYQLNMMESDVCIEPNICGTIHCVGGWYVYANFHRKFIKERCIDHVLDYNDGADLMALDLGFKISPDLRCWAYCNPEIWGNRFGGGMFSNRQAWGFSRTLKDVVEHLKDVQKRLPR